MDFPNETAFVRFLSPPFHASPAILGPGLLFFRRHPAAFTPAGPSMAPAGFFLRGIVRRVSFGNWRTFRRTRCDLNGGSGFCRFVRYPPCL